MVEATALRIVEPAARGIAPRRTIRPRRPLGEILVENRSIDPAALVKALALQSRQDLRLGDILLAHNMVDERCLTKAIATQYGTFPVQLTDLPPDPRLIDAVGVDLCLSAGFVPVRKIGDAVLIATANPGKVKAIQSRLPEPFRDTVLAFASETDIHAAILETRNAHLTRKAETRVNEQDSCRFWYSQQPRLILSGLALSVLAGFLLAPATTFMICFGWAMFALLASTGLKIIAAWTSWRANAVEQRKFDPLSAQPTSIARLPMVSILVPLFREENIAIRLVERLSRLTYPKELLDVCLVTEEDDSQTRAMLDRAKLPGWMRVVTVPTGQLKTKPRALNFALDFCRGSIVGVYDAEDAPEPGQIHKVVQRFHNCGPEVACVQGALDYYNTSRNWLSRCFTVEYAAWFRVILPGISKLGLAVPLGGTTLFFRRDTLAELGGWDAHNVTEDADLGIRLARRGYRTEVINSATFEEANCRLWPWIKQRSRWLKGYAMTWSTHMRNPLQLYKDLGSRAFWGFQIMFLGTLSQFLLVPALLSCWLLAFGLPHPLAGHLTLTGYLALGGTMLFTEVVTILVGMMGVTLAGKPELRLWVPSLHIYYPLAALATYKGVLEMIFKPFYWDKTLHGVADDEETDAEPLPQDSAA